MPSEEGDLMVAIPPEIPSCRPGDGRDLPLRGMVVDFECTIREKAPLGARQLARLGASRSGRGLRTMSAVKRRGPR